MKYVFLVDCENIPVVKFNGNIVRAFNISNKNDVVIYAFHNNAMLTETHTDSVTYIPIDTYRVKDALDMVLCSYLGMSIQEFGIDAEYYVISNDKGYTIPALYFKKLGYCVRLLNRDQLSLLGRGKYKNYLDMIETELMLNNIEARANRSEEKSSSHHCKVFIPEDVLAECFADDATEAAFEESLRITDAYQSVCNAVKIAKAEIVSDTEVKSDTVEPVEPVDSKSDVAAKEKNHLSTEMLKKRIRNGNFDYACPQDLDKRVWRMCCIVYLEHLDIKKPKLTILQKLKKHAPYNRIDDIKSAFWSAFSEYR